MSGLEDRFAGRDAGATTLNYDEAKALAAAESPEERRALAERSDAQP